MSTPQSSVLTAAEYLAIERKAEIKSELIAGRMYAMSGVSRRHSLVAGNLSREIGNQIRNRPCEVHQSDMRVKVDPTGMYTYPDVIAVCGEPRFEDEHIDTLLNPTVLVEVLSDSTEAYDRGEKFAHYRRIESLREYVLVAQNRMRVEHYIRDGEQWILTELSDPGSTLALRSIGCEVPLAAVYEKVEFAETGTTG